MAANWTAFTAGQVLTAAQLNGVVDNFADIAIFNETQSSGTNGGASTTGSYIKRTLNTTVINNITGCSIASSVITLPAGTYQIAALCPTFATNVNRARLYDTTNSAVLVQGQNCAASSGDNVFNSAPVTGSFTLAGSTNIELQHRFATAQATNGLGGACSFGDDEVYSEIMIRRLA